MIKIQIIQIILCTPSVHWLSYISKTFKEKEEITEETNRRLHIHPFSIVFWAFYEQSGGSLALFAKTTCVIICCF
jgi:dipeptide/tripeptide permease